MTVEPKDLKLLKTDYTHRIRAVETKLRAVDRRLDWVEKLLWLSAGALISWLITIVLRSV
jgi:hypothetical protein